MFGLFKFKEKAMGTPSPSENEQPQIANTEIPPTPTKVAYNGACSFGGAPPTTAMRKLLPIATFFMVFATVMTVLILYMDNTAMKHYQFRVNMSQDVELLGVAQDNPDLVTYIREVFVTPAIEPNHKPIEFEDKGPPESIAYVLFLLNNKDHGIFVESGAYNDGKHSRTEWLEKKLSWKGLLIQPDPRHYFNLRRHNRTKSKAVHACLSPQPYPKEVTLHHEHETNTVKINSILTNSLLDDPAWFNTRVKCFPLYSLMLAINATEIDYFFLEAGGTELQVLETIPFEEVSIKIISVSLEIHNLEKDTIIDFLRIKNYKLMSRFYSIHVFMYSNSK